MAVEGPHQRAGLALGSQRRVDRPDRAFRRVVGADLHQVPGELGGRPQRHPVVGAVDRFVDEDDVDVADVVELVAAALSHRDHGEPSRCGALADPGPGHREGGVERAGGKVGQLGGDVVDSDVVGEVAGGQPEQDPSVLHPQGVARVAIRQGRDRGQSGARSPGPAPTERIRSARTAYAAGRVDPNTGSVSSRQCSGCRWR